MSGSATPPASEYEALRKGFGMVELAGWSSISLAGADRQTFLNNFCTNDVKRLTPGENCEVFFTDVKGKTIGHAVVTCRDEELVAIAVPGQASVLVAHLDRYLIREDVQLRDTTAEKGYLLVSREPAGEHWNRDGADGRGNFVASLGGLPLHAIAADWIGFAGGYAIELPTPQLQQAIHTLAERDFVVCGPAALDALRIESGVPLFGRDFDQSNFPQEVGRDTQAISFTKGCYLGQETVARIDALGHVNKKLCGVRFGGNELPDHGMEVSHGGKSVGHVGSAAYSPRLGVPLALAMVRQKFTAPGSQLESPIGPCEVVALPV